MIQIRADLEKEIENLNPSLLRIRMKLPISRNGNI